MNFTQRLRRVLNHKVVDLLSRLLIYLFKSELQATISLKSQKIMTLKNMKQSSSTDVDFAIVLQGPVADLGSLNYLQDTVNIYRRIFPDLKIIVSSYINNADFLNLLDSNSYDKLHFVDDSDLKSNFERQVRSASEGIYASREFNPTYVIKSRVDQRLTEPTAMLYFKFLLEKFSPNHNHSNTRIVGSSFNSWLYRPLGISDMLIVGKYADVAKYWEFNESIIDYDLTGITPEFHESWLYGSSLHFESFLAARYIKEFGFKFSTKPIEDSNLMWRDFMTIADAAVIGHQWRKRNNGFIGNTLTKYSSKLNPYSLIEISFSHWLAIYSREFSLIDLEKNENF